MGKRDNSVVKGCLITYLLLGNSHKTQGFQEHCNWELYFYGFEHKQFPSMAATVYRIQSTFVDFLGSQYCLGDIYLMSICSSQMYGSKSTAENLVLCILLTIDHLKNKV